MYNELIPNSMYCNVSVCTVRRTVIVLASGPTRCVHSTFTCTDKLAHLVISILN